MTKILNLLRDYPVAFTYAIQALIAAVFGVLTAFSVWTPSADQLAALMALYVAFMALLAMFVTGKVTPVTNSSGTLTDLTRTPTP